MPKSSWLNHLADSTPAPFLGNMILRRWKAKNSIRMSLVYYKTNLLSTADSISTLLLMWTSHLLFQIIELSLSLISLCVILKDSVLVANFGPLQIIKRANERGVDPISLSAEFCQEFLDDMADLQ